MAKVNQSEGAKGPTMKDAMKTVVMASVSQGLKRFNNINTHLREGGAAKGLSMPTTLGKKK